MSKFRILTGLVVLLYVLSIAFQFIGNKDFSYNFESLILPTVTIIYFLYVEKRSIFFSLFLVVYSISDLSILIADYIPKDVDYFLGNSLYVIAYVFLLIEVFKSLSIWHVVKNYKIHILVLIILNVYLIYVLQVIVDPQAKLGSEYYMELVYNVVTFLLLSVALLNYFYKDDKKSLYLFIGALCIVFSEIIDVAYLYITQRSLLNISSITLAVISFYFFFQHSKLNGEERKVIL
ncbi:hypothetical protein [Snuella lapsa]|uniref:YhhN-like protein n=1 Tax=Snuella lapsa TaxID=870481 RepID=A0ABP6YAB0_9FLAO